MGWNLGHIPSGPHGGWHNMREQKDARSRVDALTAPTSNKSSILDIRVSDVLDTKE
jgi:hypothetical protein